MASLLTLAAGCRSVPDPQLVHKKVSDEVSRGDLQAAAAEAEAAFNLYNAKSPEWGWRFRILQAQILVTQSNSQQALAVLNGKLPDSLQSSDVAVRKALFEGWAYRIEQNFPEAKNRLAQAEQVANSSQPALLSEVLNAQGNLDFDEQEYSAAEGSFRRALASANQYRLPRQQLAALGNLARVTISNRRFGEAIDQSQSALKIARSAKMGSIEAALLGNLGWCYFQLGDFVNALEYFKQAKEASERLRITGNVFYWEENAAQSHQELHEYALAKEMLKRTLESATKLDHKQTMTEALNSLVRLNLITGDLEEAKRYNQLAQQLAAGGQEHLGVLETRFLAGRIGVAQGYFLGAEKLFHGVLDESKPGDSLNWEAEAGLARMYDSETSTEAAEREYRKSIELFEAARHAIEDDDLRISFLARGIETYEAYVEFLLHHGRILDALRAADQSRSRTLAEGLKTASAYPGSAAFANNPQRLSQRLKATLLFYWLGEQHSYLWVVTPTHIGNFVLPSAQEIDPVVKSYQEALVEGRDPLEEENANGKKLYEMLVAPAKELIPQGARVVLLPDGSLYGLNFETLLVPGQKLHYWIEDATVTTASSLALLAGIGSRAVPAGRNIFLVGDTVSPNADFPKLQHAAAEMQEIEKYFPENQREVLSGGAATPAAYLRAKPEKYSYLHFVTHGTASRTRPLESAVVLSNEKDEDSYKLYARDIVKRRLSAKLVIISACNGAGTRAFSGEGLVGLSWAFLRAGAHNVIGALWEVSDSSTPQLMNALYGGLSRGQDPAAALRNAKLSMMRSEGVQRKPVYWAPFQLYAGS